MPVDPILVVGAGPTGLFLAIVLKTIAPGVPVRIIEKESGPSSNSRAFVVHARTLEFYDQLRLIDKILAEAKVLESIAVRSDGVTRGRLVFGNIGAGLSKYPYVVSLPQDRHERILSDHLKSLGVEPEWGTSLEGLQQFDDYVEVMLNGKPYRAAYVAGCDGGSSTTRKCSHISMDGGTYPQRWFVMDLDLIGDAQHSSINLCPSPSDFLVYLPLPGTALFRVIGSVNVDHSEQDLNLADITSRITKSTGFGCGNVKWFSTYQVHHRVASKFQDRRVFLLGDASHLHSPVGGQGMNTGLGDAMNLGWKLALTMQYRVSSAILDTYALERRPFAQMLVGSTDRMFGYTIMKGIKGWLVRNVLLPHLLPMFWRLPWVPPIFFRRVSQIGIEYRESPLSVRKSGDLKAGDRLPWLPLLDDESNFDPLKQMDWQVHVYGTNKEEKVGGFPTVSFPNVLTVGKSTLDGTQAVLVRPDGYVALVFQLNDQSALQEYVQKWDIASAAYLGGAGWLPAAEGEVLSEHSDVIETTNKADG